MSAGDIGNRDRERLLNWDVDPELVVRRDLPNFNRFPSRQQLFAHGMPGIAAGWLPKRPLIDGRTRTLAMGSCFASNFILWLAEHGLNTANGRSPYGAFERLFFDNVASIAQQFRWAFDELDASTVLWIDKNRKVIEATEEDKLRLRNALTDTDVLIITLGLSEVWYDKATGEPLWRPPSKEKFDPERHVYRVETVEQTRQGLEVIESLRRRHLPQLKMIYTVSPVPLIATFRPVSALTANCVSKSILRAALDEFLRANADVVGSEVFYFPSYEFVTNLFVAPMQEDNRHVTSYVVGSIMAFFAETYCDFRDVQPRVAGSLTEVDGGKDPEQAMQRADRGHAVAAEEELTQRILELEAKVTELDEVCAARARVIDELDRAARERLALVEELQSVAGERLAGMQRLAEAAEQRLALIHRLQAQISGTQEFAP